MESIGEAFDFFSGFNISGVSCIVWFVGFILLGVVAIFVKGNK